MGRQLILVGIFVALTACGSTAKTSFMLEDTYDNSAAEPAAFAASSMHFRKSMPLHKKNEANSWEFYFKHCSMNGNESYFSKTSYDCSGPYY